jgi:hypothetical protein
MFEPPSTSNLLLPLKSAIGKTTSPRKKGEQLKKIPWTEREEYHQNITTQQNTTNLRKNRAPQLRLSSINKKGKIVNQDGLCCMG